MKLGNKELMEEFYEDFVREEYPGLSFDRCRDIVSSPWLYLKEVMASGTLMSVRLKYFGIFVVHPKRVTGMLDKLKRRFKEQRETPQKYARKMEIIKGYLENEDNT